MSINFYQLDAINAMLDDNEEEVKGLAKMFLEFVPGMMGDLQSALDQKDWIEAGKQAHKLKSTIRIWKVDTLLDDIFFIEQNGKSETATDEMLEKNKKVQEILLIVCDQIKVDFSL